MGVCYPQPLLFGGGLAGTNAYIYQHCRCSSASSLQIRTRGKRNLTKNEPTLFPVWLVQMGIARPANTQVSCCLLVPRIMDEWYTPVAYKLPFFMTVTHPDGSGSRWRLLPCVPPHSILYSAVSCLTKYQTIRNRGSDLATAELYCIGFS